MSEATNEQYIYTGHFDLENNKVIVSDPSYEYNEKTRGAWELNTILDNVEQGKWNTWVYQYEFEKDHKRNGTVYAFHSSIINKNKTPEQYEKSNKWVKQFDLGVDTGHMTICDYKHYRNDDDAKGKKLASYIDLKKWTNSGDKWYSMVCNLTTDELVSIIPGGIICSTGWGDGIYDLFVLKQKNKVVGIKIVFIKNDNTNDDTNDDADDDKYKRKYMKYKYKYLKSKNK